MKKNILFISLFFLFSINSYSTLSIQRIYFNGNNICNYFQNTGIFNQNSLSGNFPGFFWPCGSGNQYCYTAGINAICKIDNHQAMFACSYKGELCPGFIPTPPPGPEGLPVGVSGLDFKIYSVKLGDNGSSNPDYANWYKMIPYGAPYIDVNNNCIYDAGIDIPGVKDASQTIFVCLQDACLSERKNIEGFGGGITSPYFNAEVHMTVWGYDVPYALSNAQFIKYEIINKGIKVWDSTFFALYVDPDIGSANRNFMGCDSVNNLGYCYYSDSTLYGAFGIRVLKGPVNKVTGDTTYMSSFTGSILGDGCGFQGAYAYQAIKGYKWNHVSYLDPTYIPPRRTKFVFSGDPEQNTGWTPAKGFINNCNNIDTGTIQSVSPTDIYYCISFGADNLKVFPGDTQTIYLSQMVAEGYSNTNSVTRLKNLSNGINYVFKNFIIHDIEHCNKISVPLDFSLNQNYPNPFNAVTKIQFSIPRNSYVKLTIYDVLGREVNTLANGNYDAGFYEFLFNASNYASGIYFYRMEVIDKTVSNQKIYSRVKKMAVIK